MTCVLYGRVTSDVKLEVTNAGKSFANFSVAVQRKFGKDKDTADFFNCVAWGQAAELLSGYFPKGKPILIRGRGEMSSWVDQQTNQKRSKFQIVVEEFDFPLSDPTAASRYSSGSLEDADDGLLAASPPPAPAAKPAPAAASQRSAAPKSAPKPAPAPEPEESFLAEDDEAEPDTSEWESPFEDL
jgi:single-strand DNA-binding protein